MCPLVIIAKVPTSGFTMRWRGRKRGSIGVVRLGIAAALIVVCQPVAPSLVTGEDRQSIDVLSQVQTARLDRAVDRALRLRREWIF